MNDSPAMSGALEDLEESLQHALELVTACQERSSIRRLISASDLSKQLHRVKDDILNKVMLASFAVNTQATIVLLTIQAAAGGHPPPRQPEDAGVVDSTDDARTEFNDVENSVIAGSEVPLDSLLVGVREFRWSELKDATNSFSDGNIIAQGGSFIIYKGVLKGGNIVAIKRCHSTKYVEWPPNKIYDLLVSKLQHENIVRFVGYCYQVLSTSEVQLFKHEKDRPRETEFLLVEEYMANGSLWDIIHDSRLHWPYLFQIIQGIAQGLHYLHEQRVVHMDVKPLNIILDSNMNPKITDFELSEVLPDNVTRIDSGYLVGTMRYAAPEYIVTGMFSTKSDVYAFGITLLETVSSMCRSKPPLGQHWRDWEAWKAELMKEELDPALFEASDLKQIRRCMQIGLLCTHANPECRPNMDEVLEVLNGYRKLPKTNKFSWSDEWCSRWCGFNI